MADTVLGHAEYVIFDMDGLLSTNTEDIWTEVTNSLLRKYGFDKPYGWEYKVQTMGRPVRESSEKLFSFYPGLSDKVTIDEWMADRSALHREAFKSTQILPGALELVKHLKEHGVPIAIATGSNNANYKWKTGHLQELFGLFPPDCVFTADSGVGRGKPHPDIYLAAARALGQDVGTPEEATEGQLATRAKGLVFEDAVLGVNSGVAAGMNVIWVPHRELRKLYREETFGAAQTLDTLSDFKPQQWGLTGF